MSLFDVERTRGEDSHGVLGLGPGDSHGVLELGPGDRQEVLELGPGDSHGVLELGPGETQFVTVTSKDAAAGKKRALWTFLPSYSVEAAVQVQREERQLSIIYI